MDKLKLHTADLTAANIEKLAALFPSCVTEARDEKGVLKRSIDFDQLRQELSDHIVEGPRERYHLEWPGKREALLAANAPIAKTLRPRREESVDFDSTRNLFIEGDNLDALKLLQETYLGKVKLIYIDPPYNTGNDFIYEDDFAESAEDYKVRSNQKDEIGNRMVDNKETNGRFHSDWLTMMYSRCRLARNLLQDDGVLFISIDDHEVANLRKICDEIFGETNLIIQICHKSRASVSNDKIMSANHNHILLYAKSLDVIHAKRFQFGLPPDLSGFTKADERGAYKLAPVDGPGGAAKGNPYYEFLGVTGYFRFSKKTMEAKFAEGRIVKAGNGLQQKLYLAEMKENRKTDTSWWDDKYYTSTATSHLSELLGAAVFDNPKPVPLLRRILEIGALPKDSMVLDFFAGSGTAAHAVMEMNAADAGQRQFILVQIEEQCPDDSEAYKRGFRKISEITRKRLIAAGTKVRESSGTTAPNLDTGFRVLKIDTSNMADVYYAPDAVKQTDLVAHTDNIKPGRTPEDLLFQVLVDWGVDLSLPITQETVAKKKVFFVDGNALAACFDPKVSEDLVKELAKRKPLRAVFRDSSYDSDSVKINVEQIFKLLSPETEVKSL